MGIFSTKKEISVDTTTRTKEVVAKLQKLRVTRTDRSEEEYDGVWIDDTSNGYRIYKPVPKVEELDDPHIDTQHLRELIEEKGEVCQYPTEVGHTEEVLKFIPSHEVRDIEVLDTVKETTYVEYDALRWSFDE